MSRSSQGSFSSRAVGGRGFVAFFHPAYPDSAPPLLTLAAVDQIQDGDRVVKGINYDTAKAACGIVTGNCFDNTAYFALKCRSGWIKFRRPADGLLRATGDLTFYFVLESPFYRYPVVPSFDHWRFPHSALPQPWAALGRFVDHHDHDAVGEPLCFRETGFALVAPFSHLDWYESNNMEKYCRRHGPGVTGVPHLFNDIHYYFHQNRMTSIPRGHCPKRLELHPELILHNILDTAIRNHSDPCSNNRQINPLNPSGIHREHLFARFAFHVFSDANFRFLNGVLKYTVQLFDINKAEQYTSELYSDDIMKARHLFLLPKRIGNQRDEYDDSDDSTCSIDETPDYMPEDRTGRTMERSPEYYHAQQHRPEAMGGADQDVPMPRPYHSSSIGGLSLSSTLTTSSLETPSTGRTPRETVDKTDNPCSVPNLLNPENDDDYEELLDTSRYTKRPRLE